MQQRLPQGLRAVDGGSVEGSDEDRVTRGIQRRTVEQIVGLLATTLAKTVGEPRPPGIAKNSATTEASSGEAGPSWTEADGTTSADDTAPVKSAGEARPPGIAKCSAVTERELAKSFGGVGSSQPRANGSASGVADVKSAGKARPPWIAKQSATTERELAQSSEEAGPEQMAATPPQQPQNLLGL